MSTAEELKSELSKVKEIISERKNQANELKLPGKIRDVALNHGEHSDWGGGEYNYREKGLSVKCQSNRTHVNVNLGYNTEDVFCAKLHQNDVGEIHLYVPGEWEKRIEELYEEIPELQRKRDISSSQKELNQLKKKMELR